MTESRTLCVNGARYFHKFRIHQVEVPFDLLAWLKSRDELPKVFWHGRDGVEVAACGSVLTLQSPPHFDSDNDSPAHFWGGHSFFPSSAPKDAVWRGFPSCAFFIPKIELIRKGDTTTVVQHAINGPLSDPLEILPRFFKGGKIGLKGDCHLPHKENWKELIEGALEQIGAKHLDKVVMGRRTTIETQTLLDPFALLSQMPPQAGIRFALQFSDDSTFIGATPERLYMREGLDLYTEALAGTCPIDEPEITLLQSEKDRREFNFVKTSIRKGLEPLCNELKCEEEDRVISTPKVRHLYNPFTGSLKKGTTDEAILAALHPTAAMGGLPKQSALEHLAKHEPFERGWYASPIGYISQDKAEFCVGIRSALIEKEQMHLFAAVGIVEGSHPEKEWEELESKTSLWRPL